MGENGDFFQEKWGKMGKNGKLHRKNGEKWGKMAEKWGNNQGKEGKRTGENMFSSTPAGESCMWHALTCCIAFYTCVGCCPLHRKAYQFSAIFCNFPATFPPASDSNSPPPCAELWSEAKNIPCCTFSRIAVFPWPFPHFSCSFPIFPNGSPFFR